MTTGTLLTLWTARFAFLLWAAALAGWLRGQPRGARLAWTSGFAVYLGHVAAAFHFHHHWSHAAAYEDTARQTAELFGVASGAGLYWNYTFTAVWAVDVAWTWWNADGYRRRPRWVSIAIHTFLAFMFFNAAVVFVPGWQRWVSLALMVSLAVLWRRVRGRRA